jgi:hypothetical protein
MKNKLTVAVIAAGTLLGGTTLALAQAGPNWDPYPEYALANHADAGTTGAAPQDVVPFGWRSRSRGDSWGTSDASEQPWSSSTNPETPTR